MKNRAGNALLVTLIAIGMLGAIGAFLYHVNDLAIRAVRARDVMARNAYGAESVVRVMAERLLATTEYELGMIDAADIAALNAEIGTITLPDGMVLDSDETRYEMVSVRSQVPLPSGSDPLAVVGDHPRYEHATPPTMSGAVASRYARVRLVAVVHGQPGGMQAASMDLGVARILPHQFALITEGDLEICVSAGAGAIGGDIRADGEFRTRCPNDVTYAGGILARDGVLIGGSGKHAMSWPGGQKWLHSVSREAVEADAGAVLEEFGGRVRVGAGLADRYIRTLFQDAGHAGSGECPDGAGACGAASTFFPSAQVQRTTTGAGGEYDLACGYAYDGADCSPMGAAISYEPFPFTSAGEVGKARPDPSNPDLLWRGLFADFRREGRCTAELGDGTTFRTFRCPTNPYGFVVDGSQLPAIPGGLLSVRMSSQTNSINNGSGFQEVLLLENMGELAAPLTIVSELPVYIVGSYNTVNPKPAMIDAPLITVLPAEARSQLASAALWDSASVVQPRNLAAYTPVQIRAVLRSPYHTTGSGDYYGGTFEHIPSVLGNWSRVSLEVVGAVEGRAVPQGTLGSYSEAFPPYGAEPTEMGPLAPRSRRVLHDTNLLSDGSQPPGSWQPANVPPGGAGGTRTEARQANARGGMAAIYLLEGPTRAARLSEVVPPPTDSLN